MTLPKPKFGLTNPVAKLAEKYDVPFELAAVYVDFAWGISGLRSREIVSDHTYNVFVNGVADEKIYCMPPARYDRFVSDCARIVQDCIRAAL